MIILLGLLATLLLIKDAALVTDHFAKSIYRLVIKDAAPVNDHLARSTDHLIINNAASVNDHSGSLLTTLLLKMLCQLMIIHEVQ